LRPDDSLWVKLDPRPISAQCPDFRRERTIIADVSGKSIACIVADERDELT
jgi:hypothetical protein